MSDRKLIDEAWRRYVKAVMPADAPKIQHTECRRAFYAGAHSLLGAVMGALDPGEEPTEADLRRMDALMQELEDFAKQVSRGLA